MNWPTIASQFVQKGFSVVPILLLDYDPVEDRKKVEVPSWTHLQTRLPDEKDLKLFGRAKGLAVVCGAVSGGLFCIDFDVPGYFGAWSDIVEDHYPGLVTACYLERSIGGGEHLFFRIDAPEEERFPGAEKWARSDTKKEGSSEYETAIETRGEGGLVFTHPTPGYEKIQGNLAKVPTLTWEQYQVLRAIAKSLCREPKAPTVPKEATVAAKDYSDGLEKPWDRFNHTEDWFQLVEAAGGTLAYEKGDKAYWLRPGKRKGQGVSASTGFGRGDDKLFKCFTSNWPGLEPDKLYSKFSFWIATQHNGDWKKGTREAAQKYGMERKRPFNSEKIVEQIEETLSGRDELVKGAAVVTAEAPAFPATDLGNAEMFLYMNGNNLRYCHAWAKWLVWNGKVWVTDERGGALVLEKWKALLPGIVDLEWRAKCGNKARIEAALSLASRSPEVAITPDNLDCDPWILNTQSGIVKLRTGELLPHDRGALCSKITNAGIISAEEAQSRWESSAVIKFMREITLGRPEEIKALTRFLAYGLTGVTDSEKMMIAKGRGGDGKTKLAELMLYTLGSYAGDLPSELVLSSRTERPSYALESLKGLRFVKCDEPDGRRPLDREWLKKFTSGGTMRVSAKYGHPYDMELKAKIFLMCNHIPNVQFDHAFRRRLLVYPFELNLQPENMDSGLLAKLQLDADMFLSGLVLEAKEYAREGLIETQYMRDALNEYEEDNDPVQRFLAEETESDPDGYVLSAIMYPAYKGWAKRNNVSELKEPIFKEAMKNKGFVTSYVTKKNLRGYRGLKMVNDQESGVWE